MSLPSNCSEVTVADFQRKRTCFLYNILPQSKICYILRSSLNKDIASRFQVDKCNLSKYLTQNTDLEKRVAG